MLRVEVHFDESGTSADELTLAGYIFEAGRIDQFAAEWDALLKKHDIPFLHMKDFAPGGPPFDKVENRIALQMQFMRLLKTYTVNGIVCNVRNVKDNMGKSYLYGVQGAVKLVLDWADKVSFDGKIAYFLEAGATGHGLANEYFNEIAADPASMSAHRYAGHAFLPKIKNAGVQAADFLAWQYHNFTKRRARADLARLDLRALLRHPHMISDECGAPPRESSAQSTVRSRSRIETVYYLPRAQPKKASTIIAPYTDTTVVKGSVENFVLACPGCYRALCEGFSLKEFHSRFKAESHFIIQCWCKTYCLVPEVMVPFAA